MLNYNYYSLSCSFQLSCWILPIILLLPPFTPIFEEMDYLALSLGPLHGKPYLATLWPGEGGIFDLDQIWTPRTNCLKLLYNVNIFFESVTNLLSWLIVAVWDHRRVLTENISRGLQHIQSRASNSFWALRTNWLKLLYNITNFESVTTYYLD